MDLKEASCKDLMAEVNRRKKEREAKIREGYKKEEDEIRRRFSLIRSVVNENADILGIKTKSPTDESRSIRLTMASSYSHVYTPSYLTEEKKAEEIRRAYNNFIEYIGIDLDALEEVAIKKAKTRMYDAIRKVLHT